MLEKGNVSDKLVRQHTATKFISTDSEGKDPRQTLSEILRKDCTKLYGG